MTLIAQSLAAVYAIVAVVIASGRVRKVTLEAQRREGGRLFVFPRWVVAVTWPVWTALAILRGRIEQ